MNSEPFPSHDSLNLKHKYKSTTHNHPDSDDVSDSSGGGAMRAHKTQGRPGINDADQSSDSSLNIGNGHRNQHVMHQTEKLKGDEDSEADSDESHRRHRASTMPSRPRAPRTAAPPLTLAQQKQQQMMDQARQRPMSVVVESPVSPARAKRRQSVPDSPNIHIPSTSRPLVNEPKNPWGDNSRRNTLDAESKRAWFKREEQVGYYSIGKLIGAGGVGTVRKARHVETGETFAIKEIEMDEKKRKFIQREIAISRLLNHTNIVKMYDVIYEDFNKKVYMVFDFINGGALLDFIISHNFLTEKMARPFFRQILAAVAYCHKNCIAHRDLKIENILIDKAGQVKVIDFGLANLYSPNDFLITNCGSIYFAAPELLEKHQYVGPEVDIWSLGVILFVMLYGRVPFEDKSLPRLYDKIKKGDLHFPVQPLVSVEAKKLITSMLTVDRNARATLPTILQHPWVLDGYSGPPKDEVPVRDLITKIDPQVVSKMSEFGFDEAEVDKVLNEAIDQKIPPTELHPIRMVYYQTKEKIEREMAKIQTEAITIVGTKKRASVLISDDVASALQNLRLTPDDEPDSPATETAPKRKSLGVSAPSSAKPAPAPSPNPAAASSQEAESSHRPRSSSSMATFAKRFSRKKTPSTSGTPTTPAPANNGTSPSTKAPVNYLNQVNSPNAEEPSIVVTPAQETPTSPKSRPRAMTVSGAVSRFRPRAKTDIDEAPGPGIDAPRPIVRSPSKQKEIVITDPKVPIAQMDDPKPVSLLGLFSVSTTSVKGPYLIKDEIERVLGNLGVSHSSIGYDLICSYKPQATDSDIPSSSEVKFEISIVKVQLVGVHGVTMKKVSGDVWAYKNICQAILRDAKL